MFIDTHAHLYLNQFEADREDMLHRARAAGVEAVYLPNIDEKSIMPMLDLEEAHPGYCFSMMGLHPCSVGPDYRKDLEWVESWLGRRPFSAVGEMGLDMYWDTSYIKEQEEAFVQQSRWALELDLPIVIHSREALDRVIRLLRTLQDGRLRGILHCFTGTAQEAAELTELGFLLGIGGVVTYKKTDLPEVLKNIPLESLVLETDAPFLTPLPHRGKRNESGFLPLMAEKLAWIKGVEVEEVGRITTENAKKLFRHPTLSGLLASEN